MRQSNRVRLGFTGLLTVASACKTAEPEATASSAPPPAASPRATASSAAPSPRASSSALPREPDGAETTDAGDNWSRCSRGFAPGKDPVIDVQRLGLMCGPSNGMLKMGKLRRGEVDESGAPVEVRFKARKNECYRAVAVAAESVDDLELELRHSDPAQSAVSNQGRRWAIIPEGSAFCAGADGGQTLLVRTHGGKGPFALRLWRLPR